MAISSELIYLGSKGGTVEIWDQKKQNKIETLQTSSDGRVLCIALDGNEDLLVIGTSDGRIQVKKKKISSLQGLLNVSSNLPSNALRNLHSDLKISLGFSVLQAWGLS